MKLRLFPKLAWEGICRNRKLYIPYILACVGMVTLSYLLYGLSVNPSITPLPGGEAVQSILFLGARVVEIFSLLFLFYTNSFLSRRRNREFGLYSVLGMGRRGICRIVIWESLFITAIGLVLGLGFGMVLSKLGELGLCLAIRVEPDLSFSVSPSALLDTLITFSVIFLLLFLASVWRIRRVSPLELLRSEHAGEKPPKANWLLALLGAALLIPAYYLAVTIQDPLAALLTFFLAVVLVILATYLLFIAGSVTICRLLQKRKKFYYQKKHFVSVSGLVFRMKRNGAGLASICILSTMVLVTFSSTASLYLGAEDSIQNNCPQDISVLVSLDSISDIHRGERFVAAAEQGLRDEGLTAQSTVFYPYAVLYGVLQDGGFSLQPSTDSSFSLSRAPSEATVYLMSLDDYNRAMGLEYQLAPGECLVAPVRCAYTQDTVRIGDAGEWRVRSADAQAPKNPAASSALYPSLFVVVDDFSGAVQSLSGLETGNGTPVLRARLYYGAELGTDAQAQAAGRTAVSLRLEELAREDDSVGEFTFTAKSQAGTRESFFADYGGLLFIGIILSLAFILAAVLIIYYKQISEGYEDQARFDIMQKVGMTRRDIRQSINAQVRTVFFAPLLTAGLHLSFAFPLVWKLLILFNLRDLTLAVTITAGSFALFALFYALVYRMTSGVYFSIVSRREHT